MSPRRSPILWIAVALLVLCGTGSAVGGIWLAALGGSLYYVVAAVAFLATAGLLAVGSPRALGLYALFVLGTLAWALWEVGLDWWPLAARGDVIFLLGLLLLTPFVTRSLGRRDVADVLDGRRTHPSAFAGGGLALSLSLLLVMGVAVVSWFTDLHRIDGTLPERREAGRSPSGVPPVPPGEWQAYGRTGAGERFSPLAEITPQNVSSLEVAWQYHTGDVKQAGDPKETTFEVTPLKIGNRLFLCTPHQNVIALDADTGREVWRYEPEVKGELALQHLTCRGLSYRSAEAAAAALAASASTAGVPAEPGTAPSQASPAAIPATTGDPANLPVAASNAALATCSAKLYMPTADGRLIALDPETGHVCGNFGGGDGQIDLWTQMPNVKPGAYYSTSPVVVANDRLIVGGTVLDNVSTAEQSGVIRGYDADSGALVWAWDSGRPDRTEPLPAGETYTPNSPNSWSISAVDEGLGLVYVPLGNQPPDQWGGDRSETVERFSSSVVALDTRTGALRWSFQTVHHDLWDYDVPAQPSLVDLDVGGARVPALVQPTKQGELFVLDRRTGTPVLPVTEVPAPQGAAKGDRTAPTQPKSNLSFDPPALTDRDMWGVSMFDQLACRISLKRLRYEGRFTPPSEQGSLIYPGNFGVFNWGGIAVDPERQIAFTTPTYLAFVSQLVPRENSSELYVQDQQFAPGGALPALNENFGAPFAVKLNPFVSALGLPCQSPPWGYVAAADLTTGKVIWQHKNGTVRDQSPIPVPFRMGVPNLGGPLMTAGGVAFLSGTLDYYLRAYDVSNGREIWKARLPAGGQATPMTYQGSDGRQYVLAVAGGHGSLGTKTGDAVIAYRLPAAN
ncbi:glucose dehydrogenase [Aureimonas sp. Leaf454]|uniref:membrane-bound PQQ-dependent dehydrogenase, glucose/quinate/shikimate family n=1 Tax=Aureimonas sp. Leaf454 TaxID=1736381 RepID=UPI0006FD178B|nr:membrane-bound PQQ-dependent dehydrogenase, glucose/quinate/shikimate family [Aureimonas sp. Leaf454]KQT42917.1 glucose dehydrogenase [Aureimonas sp. Leaf454]